MKNIVLIGASGFVGSALLKEALHRGHKVTVLVRHPEKIEIKNDNLDVVQADATNPSVLAKWAKGKDAVISAYNPGWTNPNIYKDTIDNYPRIVEGVKQAGVKRLLIVGGAGSLFVKPGLRLMDTGKLPAEIMPGVKGLAEFLFNTLSHEKEVDWVFLSPAANIFPGSRTGSFRTDKDNLIVDEKGESNISVADYAVAMINELEQPAHHRERFTVGY